MEKTIKEKISELKRIAHMNDMQDIKQDLNAIEKDLTELQRGQHLGLLSTSDYKEQLGKINERLSIYKVSTAEQRNKKAEERKIILQAKTFIEFFSMDSDAFIDDDKEKISKSAIIEKLISIL